MDTFRSVALTACLLGIVISIFSLLYPSEKFAGQLRMIFSLIFILCLVKPVLRSGFTLPELSGTVQASREQYSGFRDSADDYFIRSAENNISASAASALEEIGYSPEETAVSINISDDFCISISEVRITFAHPVDEEAVRECVRKQVGDEAVITVIISAEEKEDSDG